VRVLPSLVLIGLTSCSTLPPTYDPEGCDQVSESAKQNGSDLVVDGELNCATDEGDCELKTSKIVSGNLRQTQDAGKILVHILRKEGDAYSDELRKQGQISFCYPAELWSPSTGRYRGRFYLRKEAQRSYRMAFYPRTKD
jgi:hypothetical protein